MTNEKVTLKDVYAIVNRIEDKIDKRFGDVDNTLKDLADQVEQNRERITRLEVKAAIFGAVAGALAAFLAGIGQSLITKM